MSGTDINIDYYKILEIDPSANQQQIRNAYKRAALKSHPDRLPPDSPERATRTRQFQQVNDAYYILSDPSRRRNYDATRRTTRPKPTTAPTPEPDTSYTPPPPQPESFAYSQFSSIFEEMLREEGMMGSENEAENEATAHAEAEGGGTGAGATGHFWSIVGGLSGAGLGFIIANFPGALAGLVAGNRLGAVRDKKKMSVYEVYQQLPQADRARLLGQLAARVLQSAVS